MPDLSDYVLIVVRNPDVAGHYKVVSRQSLKGKGLLLYMSLLRMHILSYLV
jgi:hypothetical protein